MNEERLLYDIETDGLIDELTCIHCIVIKDLNTGKVDWYGTPVDDGKDWPAPSGSIATGLSRLRLAKRTEGHNILTFDTPAIQKLHPSFEPEGTIRDSLITGRLIWSDIKALDFKFRKIHPEFPGQMIGRHSLESWGHRLGRNKGDFGKATDWKTFSLEMLLYCIQDVEVNHKLIEKIDSKEYSETAIQLEHDFAAIIDKQERHGWLFNQKGAVELYAKLSQRRGELEEKLQELFPPREKKLKVPEYYTYDGYAHGTKAKAEKSARLKAKAKGSTIKAELAKIEPGPLRVKLTPFNPGSRDHIAQRLIEVYGWKPQAYGKDGKPKTDEDTLAKLDYPCIPDLVEYLIVQKRIGQIAEGKEAWLKHVKADGRIHGRVHTNGAVTGRCTHSNPNVAQVPSIANKKGEVPYGRECRALWTVPDGYKLVGCDASGLELRCLAHYLAAWDGGEYAKIVSEGDVHAANQEAAGLPTRDNAKTFIYAWLYGAQPPKIGSIVAPDKPTAEQKRIGKRMINNFLKKLPALAELKRRLNARVEDRGYVVGLDGRFIPVRSKHSVLNTLLQGAGAAIMKRAAVEFHGLTVEAGFQFGTDWAMVGNIHDEYQNEAREFIAHDIGKMAVDGIIRAGRYFDFKCPMAAEYKIGDNWSQTH